MCHLQLIWHYKKQTTEHKKLLQLAEKQL